MVPSLTIAAAVASLAGAAAMLAWRMRETQRPVTVSRIVLPPLAMSTGFAMFLEPAVRVPWSWAAAAFLAGAIILFQPLARTSTLERRGDVIMLQRSRAFLAILLGLVALRFGVRTWVEHVVSLPQTAAILFLLSFGMILRWRADLLRQYRRLARPAA